MTKMHAALLRLLRTDQPILVVKDTSEAPQDHMLVIGSAGYGKARRCVEPPCCPSMGADSARRGR